MKQARDRLYTKLGREGTRDAQTAADKKQA